MRGVAKCSSFVIQMKDARADNEEAKQAAVSQARDRYLLQFEPPLADALLMECRFVPASRGDGKDWPPGYLVTFSPMFAAE